jgi:tryptophan synthase beta chain
VDKILLSQKDMPKQWINILSEMPMPMAPPISPATGLPVTPDEMLRIFPGPLLEQEMSPQAAFDIPEPVMEILSLWRPTPLIRAHRLEKALGTPARIYYKYEGVSPSGSHKPNTAVPQAYYNKICGINRLTTETGAGQWGSSLAFACRQFEMDLRVYMVKVSFTQKPYRRIFMRLFGAEVIPSPSELTQAGRDMLAAHPDSPGSLGLAISEAVEEAAGREDTNYALGSVLNHVLLHQTVIGQEAMKQMALVSDYPDFIYGCHGGGSNFGGIAIPFLRDKFAGKELTAIAVEPSSCPSLTKGQFTFDYGDTAKLTPIMQMYTLGHDFMPPTVHAGGLRYHGAAPIVSALLSQGLIEAESVEQNDIFRAAQLFAQTEGIVPAPESSHAIAAVLRKAAQLKEEGRSACLLFNLSGHGLFDMAAYDAFLSGTLEDFAYPAEAIAESLRHLPEVKL